MKNLYTSPEITVVQTESPALISGSGKSYKLERNTIREDASDARGKFYEDKSLWDDMEDE